MNDPNRPPAARASGLRARVLPLVHRVYRELAVRAAPADSRSFTVAQCRPVPVPFDPADIVSGDPRARSVNMLASADGHFDCGVWECSPGKFRISYRSDELVHILEGHVTVVAGGKTHVLAAGDVAYFPAGTEAEWDVTRHVKKLWVYRTPHPRPLARLTGPLRRVLARGAV